MPAKDLPETRAKISAAHKGKKLGRRKPARNQSTFRFSD